MVALPWVVESVQKLSFVIVRVKEGSQNALFPDSRGMVGRGKCPWLEFWEEYCCSLYLLFSMGCRTCVCWDCGAVAEHCANMFSVKTVWFCMCSRSCLSISPSLCMFFAFVSVSKENLCPSVSLKEEFPTIPLSSYPTSEMLSQSPQTFCLWSSLF